MENNNTGFRAKIQKFGGVLSGMVMPNIGAFITWGLITAIFLQTCLLYTSPSPRDLSTSRMPSSA